MLNFSILHKRCSFAAMSCSWLRLVSQLRLKRIQVSMCEAGLNGTALPSSLWQSVQDVVVNGILDTALASTTFGGQFGLRDFTAHVRRSLLPVDFCQRLASTSQGFCQKKPVSASMPSAHLFCIQFDRSKEAPFTAAMTNPKS